MSSIYVGNMSAEQYQKHDRYLALFYGTLKWATVPIIAGVVWLMAQF
jgi:hypothetical protein